MSLSIRTETLALRPDGAGRMLGVATHCCAGVAVGNFPHPSRVHVTARPPSRSLANQLDHWLTSSCGTSAPHPALWILIWAINPSNSSDATFLSLYLPQRGLWPRLSVKWPIFRPYCQSGAIDHLWAREPRRPNPRIPAASLLHVR